MTFTTIGLALCTPATGWVYARVSIGVTLTRHNGWPDELELADVSEVMLEDEDGAEGPWLTFQELQAAGLRTLAHELAWAAARELDDPDLHRRLVWQADEEDAEPWGGEWD